MGDLGGLPAVFDEARRLGFLGPGPVSEQIDHAAAFARVLAADGIGPASFLDLGSGGGLPGLVLAALWPDPGGTLLDSARRRTAFLRRAIVTLGWGSRLAVVEGRAEVLAREPGLRSAFPLVVARSFAAPSVTAEIGGAFVSVGGSLAVSEPPDAAGGGDRWPPEALQGLGFGPARILVGDGVRVAVMRRADPVAERWPRGVGTPTKRPLW